MNYILDEHYNNYLKIDLLYYELYLELYKKYLENKNGIKDISDDDVYEMAKKEIFESYKYTKEKKEEKNKEFQNNIYGVDYSKIVELQAKIYVQVESILEVVPDELLKVDTYLNDYFRCLKKICIGFEIKNMKNLELDSKKLTFKSN